VKDTEVTEDTEVRLAAAATGSTPNPRVLRVLRGEEIDETA
jgi:hypothetical protein